LRQYVHRQLLASPRLLRQMGWLAVFSLWGAMVLGSFYWLLRYELTPGRQPPPLRHLPSKLAPDAQKYPYQLILFLHPHCPCSRATVTELARIMARAEGKLTAHVLFVVPPGTSIKWAKSSLWDDAAAIPGVSVDADLSGSEAKRRGVECSGQALLFDRSTQLVFSGGITASRGHEGDNDGSDAIFRVLTGGVPQITHTPVYGCALFDAVNPPLKVHNSQGDMR
jgi:hypothetical protein